jgi:Ca2+-binding EF-hand superfamily protein
VYVGSIPARASKYPSSISPAGSVMSQPKPLDPKLAAEIDQKAKAADKNGDGKLTKAELEAGMPRIAKGFDMMDADKKGYVSVDQIKTFVAARQ